MVNRGQGKQGSAAGEEASVAHPASPELHAAVEDPLGTWDTDDVATIDPEAAVPVAVRLLTCTTRRLQLKAAGVLVRLVSRHDGEAFGVVVGAMVKAEFFYTVELLLNRTGPVADEALQGRLLECLAELLEADSAGVPDTNGFRALRRFADPKNAPSFSHALSALRAFVAVAKRSHLHRNHVLHFIDSEPKGASLRDVAFAVLDDASLPIELPRLAASLVMHLWHAMSATDRRLVSDDPLPAMPALCRAVAHPDIEVASSATWALSYFTSLTNAARDRLIAVEGALPRVFAAMQRDDTLLSPALRIAGNLCSGTQRHTAAATEQGLMQAMPFLLRHASRDVVKEAAWTLSNILADDPKYIALMLHLNVFPVVLDLVKNAPHMIRKEAVWCVSNAACDATDVDVQGMLAAGVIEGGGVDAVEHPRGRPEVHRADAAPERVPCCARPREERASLHPEGGCVVRVERGGDATDVDVQGMLAAGVIPALGAVLAYNDAKVLSVALEAVDNLLGKAPEDAKAAIEAHGMMDQLERLQDHQSSDVSNRAQQMLEEHYYVEEDGEPGAERFDAAELGTFKFE
eukprot:CAMPEP_0174878058 /NCGR_PEP_ID=MMETSP1114-20130205/82567_1 /TAXON_ID=312471 /ORGANISM="Neobodo designis, Strain CCAP 1951/1" /LENGTH=574 /DNA_ID=CAMNT_0016113445 /DNA_START=34 /DNA_END=1759 /DNA_ORIENTATION=+